MKTKYFDLFVESTNFILINYALFNIAMLFKTNMLFILFFAFGDMVNRKLLEKSKRVKPKQSNIYNSAANLLHDSFRIDLLHRTSSWRNRSLLPIK